MLSTKIRQALSKSQAATTKKVSLSSGSSFRKLSRELLEARTRLTCALSICTEQVKHGVMEPFAKTLETSKSKKELNNNQDRLQKKDKMIQIFLFSKLQ